MARITHVKKAQQRYKTVIVRDDEGNPKRTPVMKGDQQKVTKKGRPVFMTVTIADKNQPLDPYTCDHCRLPIEVGTPYKHITPKSGPYGGRKRTRHEACPSWQVWDYSNSLSAQLARISYDFSQAVDAAESTDDIQSALDDAAASVKEIAEQKIEGADNIESGFGHETSASEELRQTGDDLESWADEISSTDIPDMHECDECNASGEMDCTDCEGTGEVDDEDESDGKAQCDTCSGTGTVECENCDGSGEDIEAWRDDVRDNVTIVDESPV